MKGDVVKTRRLSLELESSESVGTESEPSIEKIAGLEPALS